MILVPAIDILGGRAVRLKKGDYAQVTVYNESPLEQARTFVRAGAEAIHIVDLDGARDAAPTNIDIIAQIVRELDIVVEVGGGIRTMETFERYANAGVQRIVLGSALVRDREFALRAADRFGERVVAGIDARDGMVAIEGWREGSAVNAAELVAELKAGLGITKLVYTDISRDGMQSGIDAAAYDALAKAAGFPITASGGVATLDDLRALAALSNPGCDGAIAGRAIYENAFTVEEGIAACSPNA